MIDLYRSVAAPPWIVHAADWQTVAEHRRPSGLPGFGDGPALCELLDALGCERREAFVLIQSLT